MVFSKDLIGGYYGYMGRYTWGNNFAMYQFGNNPYLTLRPEGYNPNLKWEKAYRSEDESQHEVESCENNHHSREDHLPPHEAATNHEHPPRINLNKTI